MTLATLAIVATILGVAVTLSTYRYQSFCRAVGSSVVQRGAAPTVSDVQSVMTPAWMALVALLGYALLALGLLLGLSPFGWLWAIVPIILSGPAKPLLSPLWPIPRRSTCLAIARGGVLDVLGNPAKARLNNVCYAVRVDLMTLGG